MQLKSALALCLALWSPLAPAAEPLPEPRVQVEFSSVCWGQPIDNLTFSSSGKKQTHSVPAYRRSAMGTYAGPATLEFTEPLPADAAPDAKPRITRVTLPTSTPRVILLWMRAADGTLAARAVSEDPSSFPLGRARLFNATNYQIAVKTGREVLDLAPGQFTERGGDGKRFILQIAYRFEKEGKWFSAGNNVFALNPNTRRTIFFVADGADYFKLINSSGASATSGVQMFSIED